MTDGTPTYPQPDWRDESSYDYTRDFTRDAWAWEFLRRNRAYAIAAAGAARPVSRILRRVPMIHLLDAAEIGIGDAQIWGLHFRRSTRPPRTCWCRLLASRCLSRHSSR